VRIESFLGLMRLQWLLRAHLVHLSRLSFDSVFFALSSFPGGTGRARIRWRACPLRRTRNRKEDVSPLVGIL